MKKGIHLLAAGLIILGLAGCDDEAFDAARQMTGGEPTRGKAAIMQSGCGTCHTIPGIPGADALVGPPLNRMGGRGYIAGVLQNKPANMIRWLHDPPGIDPLTAMPNLHLSDAEVRDIASYLYTLQ